MRVALTFYRQQHQGGRLTLQGLAAVLSSPPQQQKCQLSSLLARPLLVNDRQQQQSKKTASSSSLLLLSAPAAWTARHSFDVRNLCFKSTTAAASVGASTTTTRANQPDDETTTRKDTPELYSVISTPSAPTNQETTTTSNHQKSSTLDFFGISQLVPEWRRMFATETLFTDISAGLTVGCIAVPLSLAIAVASNVPPEVGLVTAAVSGVAGAALGGTTLAVTGPAAAISLLIVDAVQQYGLQTLPFITLACGALQVASGITRLGVWAKLVPVSVIAGFTTGVGTLILTGQLPKALGLFAPAGMNPLELIGYVGQHLHAVNPAAAALAIGTSVAMFTLPKVHAKIPAALLAVGGATLATHGFGLDVDLIGTIPSGLAAFTMAMPVLPPLEAMPSLTATILLIYGMTSVESLLSCAALDKMKKTPYKYNANQELVGQGVANISAAMVMGMPVTSVIARSGLNVRLGASTRLPAMIQAGFVFGSVVFFSQHIAMIPMPALSGMLITTGLSMLNPTEFKHCYAVQKLDVVPFLTTVAGMITFGLAEGIGLGCASAVALNYGQASSNESATLQVEEQMPPLPQFIKVLDDNKHHEEEDTHILAAAQRSLHSSAHDQEPPHELSKSKNEAIWKLSGPINFMSMFAIDRLVQRMHQRQAETPVSNIVLDMEGVTSLEFTGMEELVMRLQEFHVPVKMIDCDAAIMRAMDQCDPQRFIAREMGPED